MFLKAYKNCAILMILLTGSKTCSKGLIKHAFRETTKLSTGQKVNFSLYLQCFLHNMFWTIQKRMFATVGGFVSPPGR